MPPADLKLPLFTKYELKSVFYKELVAIQKDEGILLVDATLIEDIFRIQVIAPAQQISLADVEQAVNNVV